jgi:hypothetical protein
MDEDLDATDRDRLANDEQAPGAPRTTGEHPE